MMQCIWNIYHRNRDLFMLVATEILEGLDAKWLHPLRERDTRWLTNGRNARNILIGYYIRDEHGTPFWVLLATRFIQMKTESHWQCQRLRAFIEWMLMPEMIFGLWVEAEAVEYFEESFRFHSQSGEIADRPGLRTLDLWREVMDKSFTWWQGALEDPKSRFPKSWQFIQEEMENKGLHEKAATKRSQLKHGIREAYNEMAKMYDDMLTAPWIFTALTCPTRGPTILRVILELVKSTGYDLDGVTDDDGHLIDDTLEWGWIRAPEKKSDIHEAFYKRLEENRNKLTHFLVQLNFMKSKCRNELKRLTQERDVVRDPTSKTPLMDFAAEYPQIFDALWSTFALIPSSTRMSELFHAIERNAFDPQTPFDWADSRGRYLIKDEYRNRRDRRNEKYERAGHNQKKLKCSPKHNDVGYLVQMCAAQLVKNSNSYRKHHLKERVPDSFFKENTITIINKKGTTTMGNKKHRENVEKHSEAQRQKKMSSDDYVEVDIEKSRQAALKKRPDYDDVWDKHMSDEAKRMQSMQKILTKAFWDSVSVNNDGYFEELKRTLPEYWKILAKETKGKKLTKASIQQGKAPVKTSIAAYFQQVRKIAKGELDNTLMTKKRAKTLKNANVTGDALLMQFALVDKCEVLQKKAREVLEKNALTDNIIECNGTERNSRYIREVEEIKLRTIKYKHPSIERSDSDDEFDEFAPPPDADDDGEGNESDGDGN